MLLGALIALGCAGCSAPATPAAAPRLVTVTVPAPQPSLPATTSVAAPQPQTTQQETAGCFAEYRTAQARVELCRDTSGDVTYHGPHLGGVDPTSSDIDGGGSYVIRPNNGVTYTINSEHLVIRQNGAVISDQAITRGC